MENNLLTFNKNELLNWFTTDNKSGYKSTEKWLKKHQPELYNLIIKNNNEINLKFGAKIWLYVSNLKESPKCPVCNNNCNFIHNLMDGFGKYCSEECSFKMIREFNKNKINNEQSFQDSIFKNNKSGLKSTNQYIKASYPIVYNEIVTYSLNLGRNQSWSEKLYNYINKLEFIPTCLNCGNGVKYVSLKDGYRKYCSEKCSNIHTQSKIKITNLKKYGFENPFQSEIIKEKIKKTNLEKYGFEFSHQNKKVSEKATNTMIEKYGEIWFKHIPSYNANSIIYLDMLSEKLNLPIQHALNGGEKKFIKYWVTQLLPKF